MGEGGRAARHAGWLESVAAAALAVIAVAAVGSAFRLGAAALAGGDDLLAELHARTELRVAAERLQIRAALEAAARGDRAGARRAAEGALARLAGNSQLHLVLGGLYREGGEPGPAVREYRRAVELVRDYTDRRSPQYVGGGLTLWLQGLRPVLSGEALGDLNYLARALAGGCS